MSTHTHEIGQSAPKSWIGGAVLVAIGLFLFVQQIVPIDLGWLVLPALALVFLAGGVLARKAGLLIPGSILGGLSVGIALVLYPFRAAAEPAQGGMFLLALAAGFAAVAPLTALLTRRTQWWALAVASLLGLVSSFLFAGELGLRLLAAMGMFWPLVLVAIGVGIILRRR